MLERWKGVSQTPNNGGNLLPHVQLLDSIKRTIACDTHRFSADFVPIPLTGTEERSSQHDLTCEEYKL